MKIRLDKYLSDMGVGTRSEVKKLIAKGEVEKDGMPLKKADSKIDIDLDMICVSGKRIVYERYFYYMMNKPAGVVCATHDRKERTVLDLLGEHSRKDLFPVGRLDKDTEGLLLITNNGELAHSLLSPKKHVDKTYYARIQGNVTYKDVELFSKGVDIGEERLTLPSLLVILASGEISDIQLTIQEGKYHQVKRMFQAVGKKVIYLKRIRMGSLVLDETLMPGQYRKLTEEEKEQLCWQEKKR